MASDPRCIRAIFEWSEHSLKSPAPKSQNGSRNVDSDVEFIYQSSAVRCLFNVSERPNCLGDFMLKEVIDDAMARGEKLKRDIVSQILKSATLNELVSHRQFANTLVKIIQGRDEIVRTIQRSVLEALRVMNIPSRQELASYEKRVHQLEKKIDSIGRGFFKEGDSQEAHEAKRTKKKNHSSKRYKA